MILLNTRIPNVFLNVYIYVCSRREKVRLPTSDGGLRQERQNKTKKRETKRCDMQSSLKR